MASYYCNPNMADQGSARSEDNFTCGPESLKEIIDFIGTTNKATIIFEARSSAQTTYTLTTSETVPSNITLKFWSGAVMDGAGTLTINGEIDTGPCKIFGSSIVIAGSPIVKETIPEWWGALGDGATEDYTAINAALTHWLQRTVIGRFKFLSGKNYLCSTALSQNGMEWNGMEWNGMEWNGMEWNGMEWNGMEWNGMEWNGMESYTISGNVVGGWAIEGYGSILTSGLSTGYLLTLTSDATVRHLSIRGLYLVGSGSEDGGLKLDGGTASGSDFFYGLNLADLNFDGFAGNSIFITQNVFESSLSQCNIRTTQTTGACILFDNGAGDGIVSSIDMINCNTSGGAYGVRCITPTADINILGGTFILAQNEGVLLEASDGAVVTDAHFENNWEGAADLANGGAGIRINNFGSVIGCLGTTNSKQKYVVRFFVTANRQSNIIGGAMTGDTAYYAYIHGDDYSSVNIIGSATYEIQAATTCSINRTFTHKDTAAISTSSTGEDDLHTYTIPAESMGKMGGIRIVAAGKKTGANGNKTLKLHFGGSSWTFHAAANNTNDWRLDATIANVNSQAVNKVSWVGYDGATILQGLEDATIDTSGAIVLKITGECADGADTINQVFWIVERL